MAPEDRFDGYTELTFDQAAFVRRRISGFLNPLGTANLTLEHLLCEAYVQGVNDTAALMAMRGAMWRPEGGETTEAGNGLA